MRKPNVEAQPIGATSAPSKYTGSHTCVASVSFSLGHIPALPPRTHWSLDHMSIPDAIWSTSFGWPSQDPEVTIPR